MDKNGSIEFMTEKLTAFMVYLSKKLPDSVEEKLRRMRETETNELARSMFDSMLENQKMALELNRPCCQDTGLMQFWIRCGAAFPLLGELEGILRDAAVRTTAQAPLRPNCIETFDERNTGNNVGTGVPMIYWEIVPESDRCELDVYMAGGGCSLPGYAQVLMPGAGYEGIARFVMDRVTSYGLNACPPLLIGVGIGANMDTAAMLSKKALMRPLGTRNANPKAAEMEERLEEAINAIGIGPQGISGISSIYGVHIENAARHPATLAVGVSMGCWSHRCGHIIFEKDMNVAITSHAGALL